jgi:hypothetical protein
MTDGTGSKERPGLTVPMAWTDETDRWGRTGKLDPVESPVHPAPPDRLGVLEVTDWTGTTVFRDETEWRAWLDRQDPAGPLVRKARSVRRVSKALREILGRLARRANL